MWIKLQDGSLFNLASVVRLYTSEETSKYKSNSWCVRAQAQGGVYYIQGCDTKTECEGWIEAATVRLGAYEIKAAFLDEETQPEG